MLSFRKYATRFKMVMAMSSTVENGFISKFTVIREKNIKAFWLIQRNVMSYLMVWF